ncbi:unnamed protein product [Urochloa humidicola]
MQTNATLEEAKAATAAFLASVSQALQAPLATMPTRGGAPVTPAGTPGLRRSGRLASQPLNSMVRPSKKGGILVMRKLGLWPADEQSTGGMQSELRAVFTGPLDSTHFSAIRDMFPAARALSDADLMAMAMKVMDADSDC